jgi:predicted metal-dependent hydrolase
MAITIQLGGLDVEIIHKDIKNMHLSVLPVTGRVRIAVPQRASLDAIRAFAASRLPWIRRHQRKLAAQEREPPREYLERESHFVWGQRVLLQVAATDGAAGVRLRPGKLTLRIRPGASVDDRRAVLEAWYRAEVRQAAEPRVRKLESCLGVSLNRLFVQRMKTKWGSCNPKSRNVRLNTDLAKKPAECLDYVTLHELLHLVWPTHSPDFFAALDREMPNWRDIRRLLNQLPLSTEQSSP